MNPMSLILVNQETSAMLFQVGFLVLMLVVFYFILIRPQRKKDKQQQQMRNNLQIGDEITTIGGISGIVVKKSDDSIVIETGGDRSKIRIKTWAIQTNETIHDDAEASK